MVNILIVAYSIIAAIIGAGFASGQEMLIYFVHFGKFGVVGIAVTVIFFSVFVYTVANTCIINKYSEYDNLLSNFKNTAVKKIIKWITLIFSFAVYGAMISATGEMLFEIFGIPRAVGGLFCAVGSTVLFTLGGERIFTFNGVLGFALVILITISVFYMLSYREFHAFSPDILAPLNSGLTYSGYNLVSLTPVILSLSKRLKSHSDAIGVSLCVGIMSAVIMILIFYLLSIYAGKITLGELPMLTLAKRQNNAFASLYAFILTNAIITTLISSGGGLCNALKIRNSPLKIALLSALAYFLSGFGFSRLVDTAYRFCGIAGLFVCIATIYVSVHNTKTTK